MLLGIVLLGISISLLRYGAMGTDPYTTMNLGVSSTIGVSFGAYQLFINILLFIIIIIFKRKTIGMGTLVNMVMVGYTSDFAYFYASPLLPLQPSHVVRFAVTILAIGLACMGISMYMEAELGIAPYDALAIIIIETSRNRIPFFVARVIVDVLAVLIGFNFGAIVGLGTLMLSIFTGPLVHYIRVKILKPLLKARIPGIVVE